MKKIGVGYWYNVYELENGRVLKVQKGILQKIRDSYKKEKKNLLLWTKTLRNLVLDSDGILLGYDKIKRLGDLSFLGNPEFLHGINYIQDKVIILGEILPFCSESQTKEIIDMYIDNIQECWQHGFADNVYNFTINNGLNSDGNVVLIDFNEITFSKMDVLTRIVGRKWLNSWSLTCVNRTTIDYYVEQMESRVNSITLDQYWCNTVFD